MISIRNVNVRYPGCGQTALEGATAEFADGESVGLVGANGAGKSTLMRAMLGLVQFDGEIAVDGVSLSKKTLPDIRRRLGLVMQDSDRQMFMPTVLDDMVFGPLNHGIGRADAEARADEILARLGIPHLKDRRNDQISGGEKRMAAIATILAMEPSALLLDEPTSTLDPANRRTVIRTLSSLPQTKLVATHDLDLVLDTCSRVLIMDGGRVVADGPSRELLSDRALLESHRLELPLSLQPRA